MGKLLRCTALGTYFKVDHCRDDLIRGAMLNEWRRNSRSLVLISTNMRSTVATPQTRIGFQIYPQRASRAVTIERRDDPRLLRFKVWRAMQAAADGLCTLASYIRARLVSNRSNPFVTTAKGSAFSFCTSEDNGQRR
jgi:hypothetical protein